MEKYDLPMKFEDLTACLLSEDPNKRALADAEIDRILLATPEINPGFELPETPGVVRYNSDIHTANDVAKMSPYLRQRIEQLRFRNPVGRLTITQTAAFPGDSNEERRALIAAQHSLRLVKE